jgi:hypothetical protein
MVLAKLACCFVPGEKLPEVKKEWKRGGESVVSDESSEYWDLDADLQISGVPENIRRLLKKEYRARTIYVSPMPKVRSFEAGGFLESGTDIPLEGESEEPHTLAQPRQPFRPPIARSPDRRHLQAEQTGLPAAPSLAAEERELIHQHRLHRFRSRSRTSRMPSMGTELTSNNGDALNQSFSYDMDFEEYTYGGLEGETGGSSRYDSWTMAWLDNHQHEAEEESGEEVEGFQESGMYVSRQPSVHKLVAHHDQVSASSRFSMILSVKLIVRIRVHALQEVFMTPVSV